MLVNVGVHNVSIRNVKVSKREHHITYSVTKRTASHIRFGTVTLCGTFSVYKFSKLNSQRASQSGEYFREFSKNSKWS
jgi:hypothetical protein